jgi:hypothetical protein
MKKIAILALMMLTSTVTLAEQKINKPVWCYETEKLLKALMNEVGERPIFLGEVEDVELDGEKLSTVVLFNKNTDTYTIVELTSKTACVVSSGTSVELSYPK